MPPFNPDLTVECPAEDTPDLELVTTGPELCTLLVPEVITGPCLTVVAPVDPLTDPEEPVVLTLPTEAVCMAECPVGLEAVALLTPDEVVLTPPEVETPEVEVVLSIKQVTSKLF
jgi:hypothetical protein